MIQNLTETLIGELSFSNSENIYLNERFQHFLCWRFTVLEFRLVGVTVETHSGACASCPGNAEHRSRAALEHNPQSLYEGELDYSNH